MLYQLSYASQLYRKPVACSVNERGTPAPAAITAQTIRLAQGAALGKLGTELLATRPRTTDLSPAEGRRLRYQIRLQRSPEHAKQFF